MELRPRAAGRGGARPAVGERSRGSGALLLAVGSISLLTGVVLLLTSIAPNFTAPIAAAGLTPLMPVATSPAADPSTVVAPPFGVQPHLVPVQVVDPYPPARAPQDGVWFDMRVPAIGYRAVVRQGTGTNVLNLGPGHYAGTPWPGQPGNIGVAGHNTFWLGFSHLKAGDRVELRTQHGLYVYEITGSQVVSPDNRIVLAATSDDRLTLTTCYPLWAGVFATKRLIFTARSLGGVG